MTCPRRSFAAAPSPLLRASLLAVATALVPLLAPGAAAQQVTVELGAGAAVGNYTETDAGLDLVPGPSFVGLVALRTTPTSPLAAYAGLTRSTFGCEEGFCTGLDVSLTSQGLVVGARWTPGLVWVRGGMAVQGLTVRAEGVGDEPFRPGLGAEAAAGLDLPLWREFRIRPGVTYLWHRASTDLGGGHVALLAFQLGVAMDVLTQ